MSIQALRDGEIRRRKNELCASQRRRSSRLRTLHAVTSSLTKHLGLYESHFPDFHAYPPPEINAEEQALLVADDLANHYYQDSAFPVSVEEVRDALVRAFSQQTAAAAAASEDSTSLQPVATAEATPVESQGGCCLPEDLSADEGGSDRLATRPEQKSSPRPTSPTRPVATLPSAEIPPTTSLDGKAPSRHSSPHQIEEKSTEQSIAQTTEQATEQTTEQTTDQGKNEQVGQITEPEAKDEGPVGADREIGRQEVHSNDAATDKAQGDASFPIPTSNSQAPAAEHPADPAPRMQTRVSSGTIRQRSVSEIIQESPRNSPRRKPPTLSNEQSSMDTAATSQSPTLQSKSQPMAAPPIPQKPTASETTGHLPPTTRLPLDDDEYAALRGANEDLSRDYLEPLYRMQAQNPPNNRALGELLHRASKYLSTDDQFVAYRELQDNRLLKRVYSLQYGNHWSLRQLEPFAEPQLAVTHWDHVLSEMKWMRIDFRQERKEKKRLAKYFAGECKRWIDSPAVDRFDMQVRVRPPPRAQSEEFHDAPQSPAATHMDVSDPKPPDDDAVPDLDPSADNNYSPASSCGMPLTPQYAAFPDVLYAAAGISDLNTHMLESDDFIKAINDLPLLTPFDHHDPKDNRALKPGHGWPPSVSKYVTSKIIARPSSANRRRSRFDYEDEYPDDERESKRRRASEETGEPAEQTDVALFDPEYKAVKDRLHTANVFRPPSEFVMPSERFYEWRLASQWTLDDESKLKKLARDYTFNWSLIADQMRLPSHFHGAADRRTPWECFERWVELEALPVELQKTTYFKAWKSRLEGAARLVDAKYQAQLQLHSQHPNPTQAPIKRRVMPVRVERRRSGRYFHLIDAMRKLARKREQQAHKQIEAQKSANLRKTHAEPSQPPQSKPNARTPQDFSRLRQERDMAMVARQERMREAVLAQQKAQMQRPGQQPHPQAVLAAQQQRNVQNQMPHPHANQAPNMQAPQNMAAQSRQLAMQGVPMQSQGGHLAVPNMGMQNGVPQAQMQANMRSPGTGPNQIPQEAMQRMAMHSQTKNMNQMSAQQMKQYQQQQMMSPGGNQMMNSGMQNSQMSNQANMFAAMQQQGNQPNMGNMQSHAVHMSGNKSVSPHMPPPNLSQPKQLSSGHVPAIAQIKHRIQAQNPQATAQQIEQMANEQMKQHLAARQNAVNAATGNFGGIHKPNGNNFDHNQAAFGINTQANGQNLNGQLNNFNSMSQNGMVNNSTSSAAPSQQQQYSNMMRQQLLQQQRQNQMANNNMTAANGSPRVQHPMPASTQSPVNMHISPVLQGAVPNTSGLNMNMGNVNSMNMAVGQMGGMNGMNAGNQQRPPSRNTAPGTATAMMRNPSSGGLASPGLSHQSSPRPQSVRQ